MATMGEASAEVWAEEYRRTGRVEFVRRAAPYRRVMLRNQFVVLAVVCWIAFVIPFENEATAAALLLGLFAVGRSTWAVVQLVGKPVLLVVDTDGVQYRDKRCAWSEIILIGAPQRWDVELILREGELVIKHYAVRDLAALAGWFGELHKENQATTQGDSHADHG
ncbi:hypothetical protein E1263_41480 [Kribbella antibiotica]|uniref:PH domain-containing protein n=1 Tax=Kribbella antibiotica TaxID=190195 RepID=A0A4R4YFV9_9ACTN|nr:hypothetical protein [Kribbella antibiotica]TDD43675.1 hypothetical protein E1263_41480 [Kribbella antibiotica]